jgi:hypothetical protein
VKIILTLLVATVLAFAAWQRCAVGGFGIRTVRIQAPGYTPAASAAGTEPEDSSLSLAVAAAEMDADELRQHLQVLSSEDLPSEAGQLLLRRWVALSPLDATRWVEALTDGAARRRLLPVAALAWSEADLPAALVWARSVTEGPDQYRLLADLGKELVRTDPVGALDLASLLPPGDVRDEVELHAVRQWASVEASAATDWAARQPSGIKREQSLAAVAVAMAESDAPGAARLLAEHMRPGPEYQRAAIGIVQRWVRSDQHGARHWVESFPTGALRATAFATLADFRPNTD